METFLTAYIDAVEFTEIHADNEEMRKADGFAPETLERFRADCSAFLADDETMTAIDGDYTQAGHDFWLTRNGHGAGFWDGDWPEPAATHLDDKSKAAGPCELYVGDDNLIYIF